MKGRNPVCRCEREAVDFLYQHHHPSTSSVTQNHSLEGSAQPSPSTLHIEESRPRRSRRAVTLYCSSRRSEPGGPEDNGNQCG